MLINSVIPHSFYKHSQIHVLCFQKLILAKWLLFWNYFLIRVIQWYCRELNLHLHVDQFFDGMIWHTYLHAMVTVNIFEKFCWKNDNWQLWILGKVFPACFNRTVMLLLLHWKTFWYLFYSHSNVRWKLWNGSCFLIVNFPCFLSDIKGNVSFLDWDNSCHSFDETAWILTIERMHD